MTGESKKGVARTAKTRMRREIVDAMRGLHKVGAVSGEGLEKTAMRMLGKDARMENERLDP